MEYIPLVSIRSGVLLDGLVGTKVSLDDVFSRVGKDMMLYILDYDGITHSNPNLELYQRLTQHCSLWVDDGPRRIDDVMDTIMAGATNITIRHDLWPEVDIDEVFELTDGEVFSAMLGPARHNPPSLISSRTTGIIVFLEDAQSPIDFTTESRLKDLGMKQKLYLYISQMIQPSNWENQLLAGFVIDLKNFGGNE